MTHTLALPPEHPAPADPVRLLSGWARTRQPADWDEHRATYGPAPETTQRQGGERLIALVEQAGLRGRGGAAFPTARKLAEVRSGRGRAVVIANGCEGDPGSNKDHALLTLAPHLVIDGIILAAHAAGARETMLCVHRGDALAHSLRAAIAQRPSEPLLPTVVEAPARYVSSADTALVNFLTNGTAKPTQKSPRPSQRGVRGRPTLVDNVETLAHLALIARYGPEWFRACGTATSPGSTLITVSGAIRLPGVYEIELGAPLSHPLRLAGGAPRPLRAVLIGGMGGRWLPMPAAQELPLTEEDCRAAGSRMGIAAITALPADACGLHTTARALRYLAQESAGQCGPCMFGLPAIADDMANLATGVAEPADLARLRRRLEVIPGRGACAHPDAAVGLATTALDVFADDLRAHLAGQPCPTGSAFPLTLPRPRRSDASHR
jgi:NADH:ubiquinone oxidoreductase subunit F (NADH-binding)